MHTAGEVLCFQLLPVDLLPYRMPGSSRCLECHSDPANRNSRLSPEVEGSTGQEVGWSSMLVSSSHSDAQLLLLRRRLTNGERYVAVLGDLACV